MSNGMPIRMTFGISTGRSGTGTLAQLLNKQKGMCCTHEKQFCPWDKDLVAFYQSILMLINEATEPKIATVAFYWRNYLSEIFRDFIDPKVIVLRRDKEKVVESFASLYRDKNHWSDPRGKKFDGRLPLGAPLAAMFPKYDLSKKDAIGRYWEDYYNDGLLAYWMNKFPDSMMLLESEELWKGEDAQKKIFDFLEIENEDRVFDSSIWAHKRPDKDNVLILNRPAPKGMEDWGKNKALYGTAAPYAGIRTEMEFELTPEEFEQMKDHPQVKELLKEEKAKSG